MAVTSRRFGVGTFTLGAVAGTDYSCQVQSLGINPDKNEGDDITVLCGDVVPGSITYSWSLAGTVLQDFGATDSLFEFCDSNMGTSVPFTFVPSDSDVTEAAGNVIIDPLAFGTSDGAFGDVLTSDFEFKCVGKPVYTFGP